MGRAGIPCARSQNCPVPVVCGHGKVLVRGESLVRIELDYLRGLGVAHDELVIERPSRFDSPV